MKTVIAAGFVLLLTAGTAFAANTADTQGSFLDRAASFFGLRPKNTPAPGASVPSGGKPDNSRTPLAGPNCTCVGPGGSGGAPQPLTSTNPDDPCPPPRGISSPTP
jgi:hypothetical protein